MKRLWILPAVVLVALWGAAPALGQSYPDPSVSVRVADGVISGSNWCPGSTVTILFDGEQIATATVAGDGTFSTSFDPPADAEPGEHTVTVEGLGLDCSTLQSVEETIVLSGGGSVAFTGASGIALGVVLAVLLALAGGIFLVLSRRRRAAEPS